MAEERGGSNTGLAFVVGALVVVVGVLAWIMLGGETPGNDADITVDLNLPEGN